jgi:transcriptional regulator with XRE-family HTH domain
MSESNIYILIGKRIKIIREEKGFTQQEIGYRCDFEKTTMSRIESVLTNLTVKNLYKLSHALGVKIKDLVDIVD